MRATEQVGKAIELMAEVYGRTLSPAAAVMMAQDLSDYDPNDVLVALHACRKDLGRFPTIADIVSRVEAKDGRPGTEEAWAMIPKDETGSVVWTEEMSGAYGIARSLLTGGDEIGARMAFKEKYSALVKEARESRTAPRWSFSGGTDASGRSAMIQKALACGWLSSSVASALGHDAPAKVALPSPIATASPEIVRERLQAMIAKISKPLPEASDEM